MAGPLIAHINLARGFRGGERQTELLVRGLAAGGWAQRVVVRRGEGLARCLADVPGVELRQVAGNVLAAALALRGAGLVHAHEARALQAAWLNRLGGGARYLVTRRVQQGPRHHALNRDLYRRAARIVVLSRAIGAAISALDAALAWEVIPSASAGLAATPGRVAELRRQSGGGFIVGHIGALVDSHKGQRQILAVARETLQCAPDIGYLLVGSGRDEAALRAEAASLPNVRFAGEVRDVGSHLAAMDVFLYPSRHEGLGSILLDAMGFGLPVVATRVGGIPEVVSDGSGGLLCEVDDVAGLTAAVLRLHADAGLRERMATVNRARAREYSPAAMTGRYVNIYRSLLPGAVAAST
ncbi:MAG: glycosyltransferase family 4 protein [Gammaproteobacteria bacterium]|nr:glycosyltransferase family 4 protein [Gammaproteobacteria bacterium]